jgi:hypothetical protein
MTVPEGSGLWGNVARVSVCPNRAVFKVASMQDTAVVDQRASDAELILILRKTQKEIETNGESNEMNLLLHDFVRELLKQHLLRRVQFLRMM